MERVWVHVSRAPLFSFTVGRRTTVSSIHLRCAVEGRDNKVEIECSRFYLWAKYMPGTTTADGVLSDQPPHVVASFQLDETGLASSAGLTWMLAEGSAVAMQLMSQPHVPGILQQSAEELMTSLEDHNNAIASSDVTPEANSSPSCGPLNDITITLVGVEKERDEYISPWRPLLVYRWFELKQHVREATQIGSRSRGSMRPGSEVKFRKRPMLNGEVREATGLSSCGNYVLWQDGTLGYRRELVPYRRFFIPAREDKCVRVRSFPHRFADIVGEVPHGCVVEAIGRKKDPYTKEEYALLVLSGLPNAVALAETYELTSIERGKWVWGWSKIASSNGVVFLWEYVI
ncbi:unnamed protein product [Trypanosoma congolense IL3000]|uniref:WGS project CAEQ00000000 data, annotated contig 314 n=1 Tax=Trypanosoma congolense (strain IL3000) TaxID=1068625 RepID=F9WEU6_TRYCI|nr:unnamed protein product [Trypanosoma congolense IL3000]